MHANPGILRFCHLDAIDQLRTDGSQALRLITQKTSAGSSSLNPIVGIHPVRGLDVLIVTLFDGSFHIVYDVSTFPKLAEDMEMMDLGEGTFTGPSSELASRAARQAFMKAEGGSLQHADVNRTSATTSFDDLGTICWVHEYVFVPFFPFDITENNLSELVDRMIFPTRTIQNVLAM